MVISTHFIFLQSVFRKLHRALLMHWLGKLNRLRVIKFALSKYYGMSNKPPGNAAAVLKNSETCTVHLVNEMRQMWIEKVDTKETQTIV